MDTNSNRFKCNKSVYLRHQVRIGTVKSIANGRLRANLWQVWNAAKSHRLTSNKKKTFWQWISVHGTNMFFNNIQLMKQKN